MLTSFQLALEAISARRIPAALYLLDRAERGGHDPNECSARRWQCWMLAGRFENAWRESDRIAQHGLHDPGRLWDGQPFTGKRVVIRCLHGFGDAIQFIRYARLIRREAKQVLVQTHPELVSLLRGAAGVDEVYSWSDEGRFMYDQQIEITELPRAFRTTEATVPGAVPYLSVSPEYRERSRVPPPGNRERLRIGLQWGSGSWEGDRSIPLSLLDPLCRLEQLKFYSFQRDPHRAELRTFALAHRIHDVSGSSPEIARAAADLLNIDLLVTVDTMLAHLAGALGKSVWLLLPWNADWRWMLERRDSPWYPTMTLFRQPGPGDWGAVVDQITAQLRE